MYLEDYLLSDAAQKVIRLAEELAGEYAHANYSAGHLLWAVAQEDIGLHPLFRQLEKEPSELQKWGLNQIEKLPKTTRYLEVIPADKPAFAILKETQKLCLRYGASEITPLDILEAICTPDVGFDASLIRRLPIALYEIIDWRNKHFSANVSGSIPGGTTFSTGASAGDVASSYQILSKYCEDLNAFAREGRIDPVVRRDRELKQLVEILGKRLSPNVLIVGDPGVGKTAIVGGLTLKIMEGKVPDPISSASIFSLDVSGRLVAGAFKGEVEERMKSILKAAKSYGNKLILFIDEIHVLLDERGPVGSGVVNLLKPELSRGEITVIGATTQAEFQKYIEKDSAFNRRFSPLVIPEPDEDGAIEMLQGLAPKYEDFHGLKITPEAISASVKLAKKYVRDRYLPASAVELLDFTMSCAVQMNATSKTILEEIEKEWQNAKPDDSGIYLEKLRSQLSELLVGRLDDDGNEEQPLGLPQTFDKLKDWTEELKDTVSPEDIEAITAYRSGIPIGRLRSKEQEKLINIHELLRRRVVGQDHVIDAVAKGLKAFRTNLKDPREPGAVFFFTGPTGTGKTELAKAIAELLFDDEDALLRFDMSEFQESHSVATLLGAPPGYVGYDEGGILVNNVRKKPYSVVLFDEIEKAHQDIYGIFLQMLTDSRLQDKQGKKADFSNTIIIFTSNAGANRIVEVFERGEQPTTEQLKALLRETRQFKDEFLGRVDSQILPFAPITEPVAKLILNIHFQKFVKLLQKQHNVQLSASEELMDYLVEIGFSPLYGARPLRNAIRSYLTPPIADKIILGEILAGDIVNIGIGQDRSLTWELSRPGADTEQDEAALTTATNDKSDAE